MAKDKNHNLHAQIPNIGEPLKGVLCSTDELEYGLPAIVRILSGRGKAGKNEYFFKGFKAVFASEIGEDIEHEETYLDHVNLRIIIKLPDPEDLNLRESIRHQYLKQYTLGADDLKTRAALVLFSGLDDATKKTLIANEKESSEKHQNQK